MIFEGDCLKLLDSIAPESVDLVYLDPPFFTQKTHTLSSRDHKKSYSFDDIWMSHDEYFNFLLVRLEKIYTKLKDTGSIFFHCDKNSNHIARFLLERVFGSDNFRSEIIWSYKRWSNSSNTLLPAHQTIYFFSKTSSYHFNKIYTNYSTTTNIDQILQKRIRNDNGKVAYAIGEDGDVLQMGKNGVPLSDVWDIPFLNPKAKERTGYPTQKPILLLERIIKLSTSEGDTILDPFCGSGTTIAAAKMLGRNSIGFDISTDAIELTKKRLDAPVKTESNLLKEGYSAYDNAHPHLDVYLNGLKFFPVQRNKGIDALLNVPNINSPVLIKIQRENETLLDAVKKLQKAGKSKKTNLLFLIVANEESILSENIGEVKIILSTSMQIAKAIRSHVRA